MQVSQRVDLSAIIESCDDGIIAIDNSGLIAHCNRAAAQLYGYPVPDLLGVEAQRLVPPKVRLEEVAILRRVAAGETTASHRTQRLRRDGTVVPVVLTISPVFDSTGAVVGAAIIAHQTSGGPEGHPGDDGRERKHHGTRSDAHASHHDQEAQERRFQRHIDVEFAQERVQVSQAQDRFELILGDELAQEMIHVEQAQDQFQLRMGQ
ncbi:MAG TPA: PAS domain-containing protein, partial [Catenuloplanes sp.]